MAYTEHIRVSFGGALNIQSTADEIWNCNVALRAPVAAARTQEFTDEYLSQIHANMLAWFQEPGNKLAASASLTFLKANYITPAGTYLLGGTSMYMFPANVLGGVPAKVPPILSACTSWHTARSRGPGSHGRVYLPNFTVGSAASMFISEGDRAAIVTGGKALLTVLRNAGGTAFGDPVIASKVDGSLTDITEVACGSVYDVQRRRKDAAKEVYSVGSWPV